LWGEDLITGELDRLGHDVSPRTVAGYRPTHLPRSRGQKWSTFIRNHLVQAWAADSFTILTLLFQVLYAFVILDLGRFDVVRLGVTSAPNAKRAAQSVVEAQCDRDDQAPCFLIHDRDSIYGTWIRGRVKAFGTRCLVAAHNQRVVEPLRVPLVIVVMPFGTLRDEPPAPLGSAGPPEYGRLPPRISLRGRWSRGRTAIRGRAIIELAWNTVESPATIRRELHCFVP